MDWDTIVVGGGPAGLSAALVLGRARRRVLVFDDGEPRNATVRTSHGFLSRDGVNPLELLAIAREQLAPYDGVRIAQGKVDELTKTNDEFIARCTDGREYRARTAVIASGLCDNLPEIEGLPELWGKSVFTCPYCDGWEFRDKPIATLGTTRTSIELAMELYGWTHDIVVCSHLETPVSAEERAWAEASAVRVKDANIRRLHGNGNGDLHEIEFEDGERIRRDALFLSAPLRQACGLPESLGCAITTQGSIAVDPEYRTSVEGCYAAGDAVTHLHQIAISVASGARAAITLNNDLLSEEARRLRESASVPAT